MAMTGGCQMLKAELSAAQSLRKSGASDEIVQAALGRAALQLVKTRLMARKAIEEVEATRKETNQLSTEVDQHHMQLQSLLYEKNHYNKEIAFCRSFRSPYSDEDIGLITEEQFRATAPESLKAGIEDAHQLMLQRLAHEKQERLDLLSQLEALRQKKEGINQVVAGKRKRLDDVQSELAATKERAQPIFDLLGLPSSVRQTSESLVASANQLPVPLFILFHQGTAQKEAFGTDIELSIGGSEKQAEAWNTNTGNTALNQESGTLPPKKKRKGNGKAKLDTPDVLVAHPLSVLLKLNVAEKSAPVLKFLYLPQLETVTVKAADALQQEALGRILPGDTGLYLPSEASQHILSEQNVEFGVDREDRPYLWAQHLCGLDLLPSLNKDTGSLEGHEARATLAEGLLLFRKQQRFQTLIHLLLDTFTSPPPTSPPSSKPLLAPVTLKAPVVKRIQTFDEIVAQRKKADGKNALVPQSKASATAKSQQSSAAKELEEDNAMPEEGELPDDA